MSSKRALRKKLFLQREAKCQEKKSRIDMIRNAKTLPELARAIGIPLR